MTVFFGLAALLLAITLAALLYPLLRANAAGTNDATASGLAIGILREQMRDLDREFQTGTLDEAQYRQERAEIERRALEDGSAAATIAPMPPRRVGLAVATGLLVAAIASGGYLYLGTPEALDAAAGGGDGAHAVTPQQIEDMLQRLQEHLREKPDDGDGWRMLARSQFVLKRFDAAAASYAEAAKRLPADAQLLADHAEAKAMAGNGSLVGEPEAMLRRAASLDGDNPKVLALLGSAEYERGDFAAAIVRWQRLLTKVPADSATARSAQAAIADAEAQRGTAPGRATMAAPKASGATGARTGALPAAPPAAKDGQPAGANAAISGEISLAPALAAKAGAGDVLFVFARPLDGSRMPLAVQRYTPRDFPVAYRLDDSSSMGPAARLSDHKEVLLSARLSRSGNAIGQAGDLESPQVRVSVGKAGQNLRLESVRR